MRKVIHFVLTVILHSHTSELIFGNIYALCQNLYRHIVICWCEKSEIQIVTQKSSLMYGYFCMTNFIFSKMEIFSKIVKPYSCSRKEFLQLHPKKLMGIIFYAWAMKIIQVIFYLCNAKIIIIINEYLVFLL